MASLKPDLPAGQRDQPQPGRTEEDSLDKAPRLHNPAAKADQTNCPLQPSAPLSHAGAWAAVLDETPGVRLDLSPLKCFNIILNLQGEKKKAPNYLLLVRFEG